MLFKKKISFRKRLEICKKIYFYKVDSFQFVINTINFILQLREFVSIGNDVFPKLKNENSIRLFSKVCTMIIRHSCRCSNKSVKKGCNI